LRAHLVAPFALVALVGVAAAWGITASGGSSDPPASGTSGRTVSMESMEEYVAGHWVRFTSRQPVGAEQWSVVDDYANFSFAVLAVYATRSLASLQTVVSSQSMVTKMFGRDLATGVDPEALHARATVEQVSISGCRARLTLELYYPGGRRLHYVSSWVRPFDRASLSRRQPGASAHSALRALTAGQYALWQFVGDNRVGGVDTPCGI
jgi:hypothetical protein